jgi:hypothetical protein
MTLPGRIAAMFLLMVVMPAFTGAQTFEAPKLTIGAAGGVSDPLQGDFQYVAPSWDVSVRGQVARSLAIEGFMSRWRHSDETVRINVPLMGPGGPVGRIGEMRLDSTVAVSMIGFTFLPTFSRGRFTVAGGGGPALMIFRSEYGQRYRDCDPTSACLDFERHSSNGTFAVQLASSVDVRLAAPVTTFGQFRAGLPIEDPGSGHFAVSGGFRFLIR